MALQHFESIANSYPPEKGYSLLLIGRTGDGKTSFLNLLANLEVLGTIEADQLAEHLRSVNRQEVENALQDVMQSKTSDATVYRLKVAGLHVKVIDTPGFGDSRGPAEDEKHVERIMHTLKAHTYLHCVILVINGREARLTGTITYVLAQLTSIMPKSVLDNIHVVFTNCATKADCNFDVAALGEYGIHRVECVHIDNPYAVISKLLDPLPENRAPRNDSEDSSDEDPIVTAAQKVKGTRKALVNLFTRIQDYPAVHTHAFLELLNRKTAVEQLINNSLEKLAAKADLVAQIIGLEARIAGGELPTVSFVETGIWQLVDTDTYHLICNRKHSNCKQLRSLSDAPCVVQPGFRRNVCNAGWGLAGIGGVGGAVAGGVAAAGAVASVPVAVPAALVGGCVGAVVGSMPGVFVTAATGDRYCEQCEVPISKHEVGRQRWEQVADRRFVSATSVERQLADLRKLAEALKAEGKALQITLAEAIGRYERLGIARSYARMLRLQLRSVQERIHAAPECAVAMLAFAAKLKDCLALAERAEAECPVCLEEHMEVMYDCGHAACQTCDLALQQQHAVCPECRSQILTRTPLHIVPSA